MGVLGCVAAQSDGELFIFEQSLIQFLSIREVRGRAGFKIRTFVVWSFKIEENFVARELIRRNWGQVMGEAYRWLALRNFGFHDVAKTIVAVGYVLEGAALFIGRLEVEVRYKPENRDSGEPHSHMVGDRIY